MVWLEKMQSAGGGGAPGCERKRGGGGGGGGEEIKNTMVEKPFSINDPTPTWETTVQAIN